LDNQKGLTGFGNVLTNDVDADGHDTLQVTSIASAQGSVAVPDNATALIHGKYGDLFIDSDGNYSYVAKASGQDIFTYTISDDSGAQSQSTFTVTVTPSTQTNVSSTLVAYPIFNSDGTPFEQITQGNQADPSDPGNDHGTKNTGAKNNMYEQW